MPLCLAQLWLRWWDEFIAPVEAYFGLTSGTIDRLLLIGLAIALYFILRSLARRILRNQIHDPQRRYVATKTITYILALGLLVAILRIWFGRFVGVLSYLGIVSAGLAIALQKPIVNLAGWLYIITRRPFSVGDRIEIEGCRGDVIDVRLFAFTMIEIGQWVSADQATGRTVHVPNGWVFDKSVANYLQGFDYIWNEIPVTITSESNWRKARDILEAIVEKHSPVSGESIQQQVGRGAERFVIYQHDLRPAVWVSLSDWGTTLTLRYLCPPRKRRRMANDISEAVLAAFEQAGEIDIAYPTYRIFRNDQEGKPALRPKA